MLKRFTLRYVFFSICLDVGSVLGALILSLYLRSVLPYGRVSFYPDGVPPLEVYPIAVLLWTVIAFAISLYDPKRIYKATDEYQTLALAVGFYSLAIAGVLYFTFRDTSRLLMLYAFDLDMAHDDDVASRASADLSRFASQSPTCQPGINRRCG